MNQWDKVEAAINAFGVAAAEEGRQQCGDHNSAAIQLASRVRMIARSQLYFEIGGLVGESHNEKEKNNS